MKLLEQLHMSGPPSVCIGMNTLSFVPQEFSQPLRPMRIGLS